MKHNSNKKRPLNKDPEAFLNALEYYGNGKAVRCRIPNSCKTAFQIKVDLRLKSK